MSTLVSFLLAGIAPTQFDLFFLQTKVFHHGLLIVADGTGTLNLAAIDVDTWCASDLRPASFVEVRTYLE